MPRSRASPAVTSARRTADCFSVTPNSNAMFSPSEIVAPVDTLPTHRVASRRSVESPILPYEPWSSPSPKAAPAVAEMPASRYEKATHW